MQFTSYCFGYAYQEQVDVLPRQVNAIDRGRGVRKTRGKTEAQAGDVGLSGLISAGYLKLLHLDLWGREATFAYTAAVGLIS
jgi:hypothetical protein